MKLLKSLFETVADLFIKSCEPNSLDVIGNWIKQKLLFSNAPVSKIDPVNPFGEF